MTFEVMAGGGVGSDSDRVGSLVAGWYDRPVILTLAEIKAGDHR